MTTVEYHYTDSARLHRLVQRLEARLLSPDQLRALDDAGPDLLTIRPGPLVLPSAAGASSMSIQFDLSDRAVELLLAAGADMDAGV